METHPWPRAVAKYLAGLKPQDRDALTPLVSQVHQALEQDVPTEQIIETLTGVAGRAATPALLEALARLAHPRVPALLQALVGEATDKTLLKALKKALYYLKAQGIEMPPELARAKTSSVVRPVLSAAPARAYMSRIEGNGSRMVILHLPRQGQSFNLFLALCNDTAGLKDAFALSLSNKETKRYLDDTRDAIPGKLVDIPPAYAFFMIESSYQVNPDPQSEAGQAYGRVRAYLRDRFGQEPAPDILALLPSLDNSQEYLDRSLELSLEEDFLNWQLTPEELAPWLEKIQAIENSPLVLSPEQQESRMEQTITEASQELFSPEQRGRIAQRLLEMAYYLDQSQRPHLARLAQAAGEDLKRPRSRLERENPFLLGLLMFPLREMYDQEKEAKAPPPPSPGRIITDF